MGYPGDFPAPPACSDRSLTHNHSPTTQGWPGVIHGPVFMENNVNSNATQQLRIDLAARFPERKDVIDGSLAAVLAGEHVLLLGPPGTAKSALARAIAQAFGGTYFERLLTKFSTPEELFGAISLKALEQDRFARVVTGKLPEAEFAFIDEIWKSSSAILNSLLTLVNERLLCGAPHNSLYADNTVMPRPIIHSRPWPR